MLRMCQLFAACQCYQLPRTIHHLRHPFLLDRRIRNVSCPSSSSSSSSFHPPLNEIYHNDDDDVNFFYLTTATSTVTVLQNAQEVAIFTILSKNFLFHVSMFFFQIISRCCSQDYCNYQKSAELISSASLTSVSSAILAVAMLCCVFV